MLVQHIGDAVFQGIVPDDDILITADAVQVGNVEVLEVFSSRFHQRWGYIEETQTGDAMKRVYLHLRQGGDVSRVELEIACIDSYFVSPLSLSFGKLVEKLNSPAAMG